MRDLTEASRFWQQTFGGSIWSQFARLGSYPIFLLLLLVSLGVPIALASEKIENRRRKKKVKIFKRNSDHEIRSEDDILFRNYITSGSYFIDVIDKLMSDKVDLDEIAKKQQQNADSLAARIAVRNSDHMIIRHESGAINHSSFYSFEVRNLFREGIIERVDGHHKFNSRFENMFRDFQRFLSLVAE